MRLWNIKSYKEHKYNNLTLKSQKEVLWAAWLDYVGVPYEYEKIKVPLHIYGEFRNRIPDYVIKTHDENWILEVKGELTPKLKGKMLNRTQISEELLKLVAVAQYTQCPTFMACNWPGIDTERNSRVTKKTNRSNITLIMPNDNTVIYSGLGLVPSMAERLNVVLNSTAGHMDANLFRQPNGLEYCYIPYFKTLIIPTVYFRLPGERGKINVSTVKPAKLSQKEWYIQKKVRAIKFK